MADSVNQKELEDPGIMLPDGLYTSLTHSAKRYFRCSVYEYAEKLASESRSIEKMEHTGEENPEVTAAHVEEAKWVLIRRQRRSVSQSKWVIGCRIAQGITAAFVGVGASNFKETWGAVMCVVAVFLGSIFLLAERELARDL